MKEKKKDETDTVMEIIILLAVITIVFGVIGDYLIYIAEPIAYILNLLFPVDGTIL